ncbi:hypothetical protein ACFL4J_02055 [Candidatus Margulisiibacteriota bacterium]
MRKNTLIIAALCLTVLAAGCANPFASSGEKLLRRASDAYLAAAQQLRQEKKTDKVYQCRAALTRLDNITSTYTLTEDQAKKQIKEAYPDTTDQRIAEIIKGGRLPQMKIAGRTYYFEDFLNTVAHIYPDFRGRMAPSALGKSEKLFQVMSRYIYQKDTAKPGQTLVNPINYLAEGRVVLKRQDLPKKGLLKVWLPLPLTTAAQPNVKIISIFPGKYIKYPLKLDGDIGLAYFEIPLSELTADTKLGFKLTFTHYEERFKVDPDSIGTYDKQSWRYR